MTTPTTTLGDRVAAAVRAHMGWQRKSVADLAKVLGLGAKAARRRYNGAQEFSLYEVERLADWLEVDKYDLAAGRLPEHAA
ncbi:hypothetical protein OVA14_07055 [Agrococcus sp. SL85]|uniref:hypothetical protein n=1 Tax=Agrococcus sp. SL85 TaxID=2995141 RepID=UPI00226CE975|nr:hypothetical protein [Agrococcus sp. SL85]WAC65151.1 hypothetical protein OVA14_07055 [Agrococcus sp. SL85]